MGPHAAQAAMVRANPAAVTRFTQSSLPLHVPGASGSQRLTRAGLLGVIVQKVLQTAEGRVPLAGDLVQVFSGLLDALGA